MRINGMEKKNEFREKKEKKEKEEDDNSVQQNLMMHNVLQLGYQQPTGFGNTNMGTGGGAQQNSTNNFSFKF